MIATEFTQLLWQTMPEQCLEKTKKESPDSLCTLWQRRLLYTFQNFAIMTNMKQQTSFTRNILNRESTRVFHISS